jgi:hypothetical protein
MYIYIYDRGEKEIKKIFNPAIFSFKINFLLIEVAITLELHTIYLTTQSQ